MGCDTQSFFAGKFIGTEAQGHMTNSPYLISSLGKYRGCDEYDGLVRHCGGLSTEMATLQTGPITINSIERNIEPIGGGDLKSICAMLAHAGCSHTYACYMCMKPRKEFHLSSMTATATVAPARTWANIDMYAHTAELPFTCTACGETFTAENPPAPPSNHIDYQLQHYGIKYGVYPIFPIEVHDWVPCVLHYVLRMIDQLFKYTVKKKLHTVAAAHKVNRVLGEIGIGVEVYALTEVKKRGKDQKASLHGRWCELLYRKIDVAAAKKKYEAVLTELGAKAGMTIAAKGAMEDEQDKDNYEAILDAVGYTNPRELQDAKNAWEAGQEVIDAVLEVFDTPRQAANPDKAAMEARYKQAAN